jgi:hypothetical protein
MLLFPITYLRTWLVRYVYGVALLRPSDCRSRCSCQRETEQRERKLRPCSSALSSTVGGRSVVALFFSLRHFGLRGASAYLLSLRTTEYNYSKLAELRGRFTSTLTNYPSIFFRKVHSALTHSFPFAYYRRYLQLWMVIESTIKPHRCACPCVEDDLLRALLPCLRMSNLPTYHYTQRIQHTTHASRWHTNGERVLYCIRTTMVASSTA